MTMTNVPCRHCSRSHRDEEGIEKCKLRAERREAREAAKKKDTERRAKNLKKLSVEKYVALKMREGLYWDRIVAGLNKDYPIREQGKWTLWEVIAIDSVNLLKTWPTDLETITALRLERHVLGDYVSKHPLALPVDGSYSLEGVA